MNIILFKKQDRHHHNDPALVDTFHYPQKELEIEKSEKKREIAHQIVNKKEQTVLFDKARPFCSS